LVAKVSLWSKLACCAAQSRIRHRSRSGSSGSGQELSFLSRHENGQYLFITLYRLNMETLPRCFGSNFSMTLKFADVIFMGEVYRH
jgi:hypothetical protein